jgi:hypothetical protein
MMSDSQIINKSLLCFLLNGHDELSSKILILKEEAEMEDNRCFHIENNFYNWLNFDLNHRRSLRERKVARETNHITFDQTLHIYNNLLDNLGLDEDYRRTKSLSKCFTSKWWKTTEKTNLKWHKIHKELLDKLNNLDS